MYGGATRDEPEQTHDDCQWLDEKDGEQNVPGNRRDRYGDERSPVVTENEGRDAGGNEDAVTENGGRNRHNAGREIRPGRLVALRGRATTIRLGLGKGLSGFRTVRLTPAHRTHAIRVTARHPSLGRGCPARAHADIPAQKGDCEENGRDAWDEPHSSFRMLDHGTRRQVTGLRAPRSFTSSRPEQSPA